MVTEFSFSRIPEIYFGAGRLKILINKIKYFGNKALLVTGKSSFLQCEKGEWLIEKLKNENISVEIVNTSGEPTAKFIDEVCEAYRHIVFNVVVSIGGGSAIDTGKAISAMLPLNGSVKLYLEGNSEGKQHPGNKLPFIAVPTTAGTGSETTKNAVLCEIGENGFKRSLRHENFVPDVAITDPELTLQCPPEVTAASGLDAFTQLFEAYTSTQASPLTDALSFEGIQCSVKSLTKAYRDGSDITARTNMSYAAMLSGIVLANAGLGTVHGFASAIGGFFDVPHGVVCGTLLGEVNKKNIEKLTKCNHNAEVLGKYARTGRLFCKEQNKPDSYYISMFIEALDNWIEELKIPGLFKYNITKTHVEKIVSQTSNKNNPVNFTKEELKEILLNRM